MTDIRKETDSLGEVDVAADKLWGAQTQRSLEHFSIGKDLIPREMISAYAILKRGAANANHAGKRLDYQRHKLIVQVCDEILSHRRQRSVGGRADCKFHSRYTVGLPATGDPSHWQTSGTSARGGNEIRERQSRA
jgi:hypothetical protein